MVFWCIGESIKLYREKMTSVGEYALSRSLSPTTISDYETGLGRMGLSFFG